MSAVTSAQGKVLVLISNQAFLVWQAMLIAIPIRSSSFTATLPSNCTMIMDEGMYLNFADQTFVFFFLCLVLHRLRMRNTPCASTVTPCRSPVHEPRHYYNTNGALPLDHEVTFEHHICVNDLDRSELSNYSSLKEADHRP